MPSKKLIPFILFFVIFFLAYCSSEKSDVKSDVKAHLLNDINALDSSAATLQAESTAGNEKSIQQAFLKTRRAYKKLEWFCEYYAPTTSKELNGAPLPEIEIEETKVFEPSGLQVIEEYIYPYDTAKKQELLKEIHSFQSSLKRLPIILEDTEFTEAHILDACKLEVFRITGIGLTGFDTPICKTGIA